MIKLGNHQEKAEAVIEDFRKFKVRKKVLGSPTGSGKTVIMGRQVSLNESKNLKTLILTDRSDRLRQTDSRFYDQFSVKPSLIESGKKINVFKPDGSEYLTFIAMVDTLKNLLDKEMWKHFFRSIDCIIIDECHEARFNKIITHEVFEGVEIIGFTATPVFSSNKIKMSDFYDSLSVVATENELIEDGMLVCPITVANEIDISKARQRAGEFTKDSQKELQREFVPLNMVVEQYQKACIDYVNKMKVSGNKHWQKYEGKNLKSIAFGVD